MEFAKSLVSAIVLILSLASISLACDCLTLDEAQSFERATAVFIGRVIEVHTEGSKTAFILKVERYFKGSGDREVKILSYMSDCDAEFHPGAQYMVYAQKFDDGYSAGSCSRTRMLTAPSGFADQSDSPAFMSRAYWKTHRDTLLIFAPLVVPHQFFSGCWCEDASGIAHCDDTREDE
jgi:hypothetical protein